MCQASNVSQQLNWIIELCAAIGAFDAWLMHKTPDWWSCCHVLKKLRGESSADQTTCNITYNATGDPGSNPTLHFVGCHFSIFANVPFYMKGFTWIWFSKSL